MFCSWPPGTQKRAGQAPAARGTVIIPIRCHFSLVFILSQVQSSLPDLAVLPHVMGQLRRNSKLSSGSGATSTAYFPQSGPGGTGQISDTNQSLKCNPNTPVSLHVVNMVLAQTQELTLYIAYLLSCFLIIFIFVCFCFTLQYNSFTTDIYYCIDGRACKKGISRY